MDSEASVRSSSKLPRWPGGLLAIYALVCGGLALAGAELQPPGWGVITRPLLGVWAIAGALLLLLGDPWWKSLLRIWVLAQTAIVIVDESGSLTLQPVANLPLQSSSPVTFDGLGLSLQGYGVNLGGLALFIAAQWIISRKWHREVPVRLWEFQALRAVRLLFLVANVAVLGHLGWRWLPVFMQKERLVVIDCPWPGVEVFLKERRLGTTPLVVTHDNMVSWGLSKPSGSQRWDVKRSNLEEGFFLMGNSGGELIHLKAPGWCEKHFASWPSEWGSRAVPWSESVSSNRCVLRVVSPAQPGLVLWQESNGPASCKPGDSVDFSVTLRHNPEDSPKSAKLATNATLVVTFMRGSSYETREVSLPVEWSHPTAGAELKHTFKVEAPKAAGNYTYRIQYRTPGSPVAPGARTYGMLAVK